MLESIILGVLYLYATLLKNFLAITLVLLFLVGNAFTHPEKELIITNKYWNFFFTFWQFINKINLNPVLWPKPLTVHYGLLVLRTSLVLSAPHTISDRCFNFFFYTLSFCYLLKPFKSFFFFYFFMHKLMGYIK